jgi:hypothetical protein
MRMTAPLVVALALVSGLLAAWATVRLLGETTPMLGVAAGAVTIARLDPQDGGVRLQLAGGRMLHVDTVNDAANARNIALLYAGRIVSMRQGDDCWRLVPLAQPDPPALDAARYQSLQARGLTDADLAWAFAAPAEAGWSSASERASDSASAAERLAVCASAEPG